MKKVRMTVVIEYEPDLTLKQIAENVDPAELDRDAFEEGQLTVEEIMSWTKTDPTTHIHVKFENIETGEENGETA
jgi:hypothetical protein